MIIELNEKNFKTEVMETSKPVLIDFWATWCGPCKMLSPIIDEIADEREDIKFCKVNVDEQPSLAALFSISSIPTLIYIKNGETEGVYVGYRSKEEVLEILK